MPPSPFTDSSGISRLRQSPGVARSEREDTSLSSGFSIRRDCVRPRNGVTPASFALIQRLNQFLNRRTQLRVVTFICHRSTKFAPVPSHVVRHVHLRYSGANAAFVGSMFGATRLSGSVVHGSQRSACIFTIWFGNFGYRIPRIDPPGKPSRLGDQ